MISTPSVESPQRKKKTNERFTEKEDSTLSILVYRFGNRNWEKIASFMPQRNARQCKERWNQYLSPNINKQPFTQEEDNLLLQKQSELGSKWEILTLFFKGRTSVSLRNRWLLLTKEKRKSQKSKNTESNLSHLGIEQLLSSTVPKKVHLPHLPLTGDFKVLQVVEESH